MKCLRGLLNRERYAATRAGEGRDAALIVCVMRHQDGTLDALRIKDYRLHTRGEDVALYIRVRHHGRQIRGGHRSPARADQENLALTPSLTRKSTAVRMSA